jgi:hypothetical protein
VAYLVGAISDDEPVDGAPHGDILHHLPQHGLLPRRPGPLLRRRHAEGRLSSSPRVPPEAAGAWAARTRPCLGREGGWQRGDGDGPAVGARRRGRTWRGGNRFEGGRSHDLCRRALASCLGGGEGRRGELGMGSCSVVPSPMWACGGCGSISGRNRGVQVLPPDRLFRLDRPPDPTNQPPKKID